MPVKYLVFILAALAFVTSSYECEGKINDKPILNLEPILAREVANGSKYIIDNNGEKMYLLNITGTPWELGYAYGSLLKDEIRGLVNAYFSYIRQHAEEELKII